MSGHQLLHLFEELAFFLADVLAEGCGEESEAFAVETVSGGAGEVVAQKFVLVEKFCDQRLQLGEFCGRGKEFLFFRGKMNQDFVVEVLLDFVLPSFEIDFSRLQGAIDAHAKGKRVLMLARERYEILVAQHRTMINDRAA